MPSGKMMAILTFVTLLMPLVMTMTAPFCQAPGCHGARSCEVSVTQEDVTTIKVDWSKVWWDLDLEYFHHVIKKIFALPCLWCGVENRGNVLA